MKVYVVQADNCEDLEDFSWEYFSHWTEGVFSSEELAEQYIEKEQASYETDCSKASQCCPHYWIEEYEMT